MVSVSLLGIPHDDNSSFMKGPAEAPPLIRRVLHSDAYELIEQNVARVVGSGDPLICLGGDHAITHPICAPCVAVIPK